MTTETLTLSDFLLARIAEDEAEANEAIAVRASHYPENMHPVVVRHSAGAGSTTRVLATCKAHRAIVSRCDMLIRGPALGVFSEAEAAHGRDILRALASVYADHPDYDERWAL